MNDKSLLKAIGCAGGLVVLAAMVGLSYVSMRFAWGLEIRSWSVFWAVFIGQVIGQVCVHFLSRMGEE